MLGAESATPAVRLESDLATLREEIVPTHAPARPPFAFPESDYGMAKLFTPAPPPKVTIVGAKVITTIIERAFSDKESEAAAMRKEAHERLTKLQKQWSEIKFIARDRY